MHVFSSQEECATDNKHNISCVIESDEELEMEMLKVSASAFWIFLSFVMMILCQVMVEHSINEVRE